MSPVLTDKVPSRPPHRAGSAKGFTFVEVMVSMAITIIVMASVFALLARGFPNNGRGVREIRSAGAGSSRSGSESAAISSLPDRDCRPSFRPSRLQM